MFALIIDVLYLLVGIYLIYVGVIAKNIATDNNNNTNKDKLFISQIVIGGFISLISGYKIYSIFSN